jgi:hypothetical protein
MPLLDVFVANANLFARGADVRRGDCQLILRSRRTMNRARTMSQETPIARTAVRSRVPARGNEPLSSGRALARQHAALPDYIGRKARLLNGFFAISVNSPSMSIVNFCCCVGSAPKVVRSVARRVPPQPMRAAVWMEAGDHACL